MVWPIWYVRHNVLNVSISQSSSSPLRVKDDVPLTNLIPHIFPLTANISSPLPSSLVACSPISDLARNFNLDLVTLYTEFGLVDGRTRALIPSRGRVDNSSGRLYAFVRIADVIVCMVVGEG